MSANQVIMITLIESQAIQNKEEKKLQRKLRKFIEILMKYRAHQK